MKRQVRRGCFETNSSSQHSLCIMKKNELFTTEEIMSDIYLSNDRETGEEDCVWNIWDDLYFGRSPFSVIVSFADKWKYACASLVREYNDDTYKELVRLAKKYIPNLKTIKLPKTDNSVPNKDHAEHKDDPYYQKYGKTEHELTEYLAEKEELWGFEIEYWTTRDGAWWHYDVPDVGSVDQNILSGFLEMEGITLEEYLINKKYVVIQDGDEYDCFGDMKRTGLINLAVIDHEYTGIDLYMDERNINDEETD